MDGTFITLEGPEGSGKSTHAAMLATDLRKRGHDVVAVREPGGTPTGEAIRDILQHNGGGEPILPETETLLFAACRAQLVRSVILPALARGSCVISDRFADSTTAYQGYGRRFGLERIVAINDFAVDEAVPDLTVLLDLPVEVGFERIRRRNEAGGGSLDRMESESLEFHQRVRDGYLAIAKQHPERFVVIDSAAPMEEVSAAVLAAAEDVLAKKRANAG